MNCPHCGEDNSALVLETRKQDGGIIRKRGCGKCNKYFLTVEKPDLTLQIKNVKWANRVKHAKIEEGVKATNLDAFKAWR